MEKDTQLLKSAWQKSAEAVLQKLENVDCAFVTLGDPSLYSTFGYLLDSLYLKNEKVKVQIVPGIISPTAAANEAKLILASGDEKVAIIPVSTLKSIDDLDNYIRDFETLVLMKIGKRLGEIKGYLQKKELNAEIVFAKKVGLDGQKIANELPSELLSDEGYFSLLILKISN
jgi:precorrin-2/cobalt-factor-2 C20-methyltransferase